MRKKRNLLKRNSGFLIGCAVAAGTSFFAANMLMSDGITLTMPQTDNTEAESEIVLPPEKTDSRTYETDAFTVTASGNVIKGVEETEQSETAQTDENGDVIQTVETDAEGNPVQNNDPEGSGGGYQDGDYWADNSSSDGSYSDGGGDNWSDGGSYSGGSSSSDNSYSGGSSSGDNSYYEEIEITNPGNGDYSYSGDSSNGSSGGSSSDSSTGSDSNAGAWTPDDVIVSGISSRYLDVSELYSYGAATLRLIRNEIFALHGRIFNSQDLMDYFSQKSWYVPTYSPEEFDANMFYYLNDYEEANLQLILDYEAWFAENY